MTYPVAGIILIILLFDGLKESIFLPLVNHTIRQCLGKHPDDIVHNEFRWGHLLANLLLVLLLVALLWIGSWIYRMIYLRKISSMLGIEWEEGSSAIMGHSQVHAGAEIETGDIQAEMALQQLAVEAGTLEAATIASMK